MIGLWKIFVMEFSGITSPCDWSRQLQELLGGARETDYHFKTAEFRITFQSFGPNWYLYTNFWNAETEAIVPYTKRLAFQHIYKRA